MKEIKLTQGLKAQVDDEDFERLNQYKWYAHKSRNVYYARRMSPTINGKRHIINMHHEILGKPPVGLVSDHIDGDGLKNLRSNLRIVTNRQNCQNRKHTTKTSRYPGVCWGKQNKKWHAQIYINGNFKKLGYFSSETKAFEAYRKTINCIGEEMVGDNKNGELWWRWTAKTYFSNCTVCSVYRRKAY